MDNSQIPLIAHQTARSADPDTWTKVIRKCVDRWLAAANGSDDLKGPEMAWFMWDDEGIREVVQKYEHNLYPAFSALPYPVEKADVFRVLVLKWFGGVVSIGKKFFEKRVQAADIWQYGDIDSIPLIHPSYWIETNDLQPWYDEAGNKSIQQQRLEASLTTPADAPVSYISRTSSMTVKTGTKQKTVNAIFGLEADNLPEPDDTYWRMGYTFPVQVTNWALAMAPHHPVASQFLSDMAAKVEADKDILPTIDPLDITGPPALTRTLKNYTERVESNFTWQSLSSRGSHVRGGISKIVASDILILPITGFSPGRGWYQNMGSQPINHPAARLQHLAAGSWRTPNLFVTYGKLCRTVFGRCREWSKIPPPKR